MVCYVVLTRLRRWSKPQRASFPWLSVGAHFPDGPAARLTNKHPWGMGAWLSEGGTPHEWFAIPISLVDQWVLSYKAGSSEGQQTWEALCLLVAMRLWKSRWQSVRVKLAL